MKRVFSIGLMAAAVLGLLVLGSLLPLWKVAAENLAAFDGTVYQAIRLANLANISPTVGGGQVGLAGVLMSEHSNRAAAINSPGAGNQASASIAANATARHVLDCVDFSAVSTGAVAASSITVNVRDGATGAGTLVYQWQYAFTTAGANVQVVAPQHFCGIGIVGTTNTAMTVEMSAGVANVQPTVEMTFYTIN